MSGEISTAVQSKKMDASSVSTTYIFDLAEYANFNEEERKMYNDSLKHKWDTENVMDFAVKTAREEERAKAENEKREMAVSTALILKKNNVAIELIADATGLSVKEIVAL